MGGGEEGGGGGGGGGGEDAQVTSVRSRRERTMTQMMLTRRTLAMLGGCFVGVGVDVQAG